MNCKLSDLEFAVLSEICKNQTTSPERLKMMFGGAADSALNDLETYDLIHAEITGGHWYYRATEAGRNLCENLSTCDPKQSKDKDNLINDKKNKNKHRKLNKAFDIAVGIATIIGGIGVPFTIIAFFQSCYKH
jgi:hypothetical protein